MKKLYLALILILATLLLASCGEAEAPEGMQLVYGSDEDGYYFYSPANWNISNLDGIKAAYVSKINITSVSFSEVAVTPPDGVNATDYFFTDYFNDSLSEFPTEPTITKNAEDTVFGAEGAKADKAIRYEYNYEYEGHTFGFVQILMTKHGSYYIFTYTSTFDKYDEEKTYYETYLDKLDMVINNFKFVEKKGAESEDNTVYEKDADGYILVSDEELCGFKLYVTEDFKVDYSSAAVSVSLTDGSNIMITETSPANLYIDEYWAQRKEELSKIVTSLTVISEIPTERVKEGEPGYEEYKAAVLNSACSLGNAVSAYLCEYTYEYNGSTYHVYQIFAVDSSFMGSGYTFTYTAKEENFKNHLDTVKKIISKVEF